MSGIMRSRRDYCRMGGVGNSPLASISRESEEELAKFSPRSVVWLTKERLPVITPPSTPPPASPTSNLSTDTSTPCPPPPPPKFRMASAVKMLIFKGVGNEEPGQF